MSIVFQSSLNYCCKPDNVCLACPVYMYACFHSVFYINVDLQLVKIVDIRTMKPLQPLIFQHGAAIVKVHY